MEPRLRKPTEKGRLYKLELHKSERSKLEKLIRELLASIEALFLISDEREEIKKRLERLEDLYRQFLIAHSSILCLEEGVPESYYIADYLDKAVNTIQKVCR